VNVTVIDPGTRSIRHGQTLVVIDGVIRAVGDVSSVRIPGGARIIDGAGRYLVPGFWDMHVHFMNAGVHALPVLLAHGVTTVREMGGYIDRTRAWQRRMGAGTLHGPRILTAAPILESPAYLAGVRERSRRLDARLAGRILPYRIAVGDAGEARRAIDSLARLRVDFVKIRTVAGADAYFAILREARRVGLRVSGHQPAGIPLSAASDSGQHSIEHAFAPPLATWTPEARDSLFRRFVRNGTWYAPSLVVSRAVTLTGAEADSTIWGSAGRRDARRAYAHPWLLEWWRMQVDERIAARARRGWPRGMRTTAAALPTCVTCRRSG
jgi:hypothetical protein